MLFPREQGCTGPAAQFCESVQNMALTQKNNVSQLESALKSIFIFRMKKMNNCFLVDNVGNVLFPFSKWRQYRQDALIFLLHSRRRRKNKNDKSFRLFSKTVEIKHYQEEIQLGYFGNQTTGLQVYIPLNYPLCQITAPLSIHYSVSDAVVVPKDVEITLSKLTGSKHLHVQKISGTFGHQVLNHFNHY